MKKAYVLIAVAVLMVMSYLSCSRQDQPVAPQRVGLAKPAGYGNGLIHRYKFDEKSGSIAFDHVKTGAVNGVLSSTVNRVKGILGRGAVQLTGQASSVVSFGGGVGQFGTSDFTVAFWLKTSETTLPLFDLVGNRSDGSCGNFFQTRMTGTHFIGNGVIIAEIAQDGACTNYIPINSGPGFNDGQRHHVAVTRGGATMTLYVDGVQVASGSAAGTANVANSNLFKIGRSLNDPCCPGNFTPTATFDELRIYNRALTADQIEDLADKDDDDDGDDDDGDDDD
jgi:hypothetical protein